MPLNSEDNKEKLADTGFISEKIKQRPINRAKLLRRTAITFFLAIVFGIVACFTFLYLQPVFSDRLYPEAEPEKISFPEENVQDELTPEEMFADENAILEVEAQNLEASQKDQIDEAIASYTFNASDYAKMMSSLKSVATDVSKSLVTVTAVSSDTNWFSESFESSGSASGVIVANNVTNYYIVTPSAAIENAESIRVTFCDGAVATAELSLTDTVTDISVITVRRSTLTESTREKVTTSTLGSSNTGTMTGMPVIAAGSPIGIQDSISYGIITSEKVALGLEDSYYKQLTTDIYGSTLASGVLTNINGQVIGIIDMSYNTDDLQNHICAIGITELKSLIEDLSNGRNRAYLGIHGTTIPVDVQSQLSLPAGAYITKTEMDSPAMKAGIQSGDILTSINGSEVSSYEQFVTKLSQCSPDDIITITVKRQAPNDYIELEIEATLTSATHN
ncbi:MAG: PDZ domain-containing protein [Butyrivibrio sp.]|nr:PDZ domain-containing protein [Butyrivibrio sp.]